MTYYQYRSAENSLRLLLYNATTSSITRKEKGRIVASKHEIDIDYLLYLWNQQQGKCYYSGIPLNFDKNEWRMSCERLNTNS